MFYKELEKLADKPENEMLRPLFELFDQWMYFLPLASRNRFTEADFHQVSKVRFAIISSLFEQLVEEEIIFEEFGLYCPHDKMMIRKFDDIEDVHKYFSEVEEYNDKIVECYSCEGSFTLSLNDIYNIYQFNEELSINIESEKDYVKKSQLRTGMVSVGPNVRSKVKENPTKYEKMIDKNKLDYLLGFN